MFGNRQDSKANGSKTRGIIPRCIELLFKDAPKDVTIYCSFVQIYNEKIYDLL